MNLADFTDQCYAQHPKIDEIVKNILTQKKENLHIQGAKSSSQSMILANVFKKMKKIHFFVANDSEQAAYLYNDLEQILGGEKVYFFPSSYRKTIRLSHIDTTNDILRAEVLQKISLTEKPCIIVSYPEAMAQKVVSVDELQQKTLSISVGESLGMDVLIEFLLSFDFQRVDFVYQPGQFAVRGSIIDVFSFANELPFRVDFFGDEVESIRIFDLETQLSQEKRDTIEILPDVSATNKAKDTLISITEFVPKQTIFHFNDMIGVKNMGNKFCEELQDKEEHIANRYITGNELLQGVANFKRIEWGTHSYLKATHTIVFNTVAQPIFHKNFELITNHFKTSLSEGNKIYIFSDSLKQTDRIATIFADRGDYIPFQAVEKTIHEGFVDNDLGIVCYTDHQIFDRFHKYQLKTDTSRRGKVLMTIKELNHLQVGDYVVHVDHGVGRFGGLLQTTTNGKTQEVVKLIYRDDDIIFVSIHSLHRISKYKGKEGEVPRIHKLGTGAWEKLKERTKAKVKDIARDLIKLYSLRKSQPGHQYAPDGYLQRELEASFFYEDTPDQSKATGDIKKDMESTTPMDRLVCGDVGFGKTEVAIRAAFKAVADGKQVAMLVPTTILAMQHYKTFNERLSDMPCKVSYLSRAKSTKETKETLNALEEGKIDVIIGTHKLVGKSVKFKDLGLLIIDEEQKFGVSVKEKLKQLKVNIDTLTLTATPIPRTLQFSLLGARDLSIINTPPPNRYPVQTEIHAFDEEIIRDAIQMEMERNGQVFFVHNRIHNIESIANMIRRIVPQCRVVVGHGQMGADVLEEKILDFIDYEYDVLVSTTIIESGVDISNVNTIIINNANRFGLSDLHQLRGRVGRTNKKAYCYLLSPDYSLLTPDAKRRLKAIETFTELGSGFHIAMQDLDIRGAGNLLGAEQSGFIADLGYEVYQKILNEAVLELKNEEYTELYNTPTTTQSKIGYVADCQIDTDFDLMFTADYINNVAERIKLYQELDNIETEEQLITFKTNIEDRFGKIPPQAIELLLIVRLRQVAIRYGIEKLLLKKGQMIAYFVSNDNTRYYQSKEFGQIILYAKVYEENCQIREKKNKRSIIFEQIKSVQDALDLLDQIANLQVA